MKRFTTMLLLSAMLNAGDAVTDEQTGLMWQDSSDIVTKSWSDAVSYCKDLSLGGYSDWRLPHIDELMSISDKSRYDPAIKPIFKHIETSYDYWSSTLYKYDSSKAWIVSFDSGEGNRNDRWSSSNCVRCVR